MREAIFNAIPTNLKVAVSVGIGLFITFIGLQNAHIVVDSATLVGLFSFKGSVAAGTFQSEGITVLLALIGILITAFLVAKNVKGNILIGILVTWLLGIVCQLIGLYVPNPEAGFFSLIPSGIISMPASIGPTLFKMDFSVIGSLDFLVVVFAFLFVDLFGYRIWRTCICDISNPFGRMFKWQCLRNFDWMCIQGKYAGRRGQTPWHKGRFAGRCNRNDCRRMPRYLYDYNLR